MVLFDSPIVFKCLNALILLISHLCIIIDCICCLFVDLKDSWMGTKSSTNREQIYDSTTMREGELKPPVTVSINIKWLPLETKNTLQIRQ